MAIVLRGPQANVAIKLGVGRRLARGRGVSVTKDERETVMGAWRNARAAGVRRSKRNGTSAPGPAGHFGKTPFPLNEERLATPPVATRAPLVEDADGAPLPDVADLPGEYLAACVAEARRRVRDSAVLATALDAS